MIRQPKDSWELPMWERIRAKPVTVLTSFSIIQIVTLIAIEQLYIAAHQLRVFAGPAGRRHWITYAESPLTFWIVVVRDCVALALTVILPCWVAWRLCRAAIRNKGSSAQKV